MNEKEILFTYGSEGGGGQVIQLPNGKVRLSHSEAAILDMLNEEDTKDIIVGNTEKEFENWKLFWMYFINKYPHWKQLHPKFYK